MTTARAFRGYRFPAEVILWAARWYLQFPISYRDLERMLADRGGIGEQNHSLGPAPVGRARTAAPGRQRHADGVVAIAWLPRYWARMPHHNDQPGSMSAPWRHAAAAA